MYYAPWDAESQATRMQFKIVAQYYYKQVYFAAINCWQPHSECRQKFSRIQQFPVLIVYIQHNKGVQYKGIREAAHMIRFLQYVLRPLERITSLSDVMTLMSVYDAVVVGCFNFAGSIGSPGYYSFYAAALKFLERDPHREVGFAVVTSMKTCAELWIDWSPTLRIYMWNETLQYPHQAEFTSDVLVQWISANTHQVSAWVTPPGVKSLTLAPYVDRGSVLILFTPRNPLQDKNYNYNMLREVGLEYYNCNINPWVSNLASHLANERAEMKKKYSEIEAECVFWKEHNRSEQDIHPIHLDGELWMNESCHSRHVRRKLCSACERHSAQLCGEPEGDARMDENDSNKCKKEEIVSSSNHMDFGPFTKLQHEYYVCSKHSHSVSRLQTSMLTGMGDERSSAALQEAALLDRCRRFRRARHIHHPVFPHPAYHRKSPRNFTGLACHTNKTLSLIAMDSLQFHHFAEGLGVDVMARHDKTAVVIFNVVQESSYTLNAEFNKGAVLEFIKNYTDGVLNRLLRSSSILPRGALNHYPKQDVEDCQRQGVLCVTELNSNSFHRTVMAQNVAVVLLYHSPYCTFCHIISHIYLTVARYFRAVQHIIFTRIDGENNDLPWEFTMHHYPTILFFPAHRKSESHVFPRHYPLTVSNLVKFVLANLDPEERCFWGMVGLCAGWGKQQNVDAARDCIARVRRECLTAIASTLKQYRSTKMRWHVLKVSSSLNSSQLHFYRTATHKQLKCIVCRLQHLKEVHLILGSIDRLQEDSIEYIAIQEIYKKYQNSVKKLDFYTEVAVTRVRDSVPHVTSTKDEL
ncbi:thioredoxin domain-containing protein 11 isoform X2 [Zootermopsis nevadensis]|nr:thioredoxin domain-containing protein 11 isoform X2 [Zootermopsis nevadensis]